LGITPKFVYYAAERLRWSRMTLYRKLAKYHIITSMAATERPAPPDHAGNASPGSPAPNPRDPAAECLPGRRIRAQAPHRAC
jgi:hypothetical protein